MDHRTRGKSLAGQLSPSSVVVAIAVLAALLLGLPATAAAGLPDSHRVAIKGAPAPGPAQLDRVWVRKYGAADPSCVLVLVPGSPAGQGGFGWVAQALANRVDGLGVWALDRRSNALEDTTGFRQGNAGQAFDYYFTGASIAGRRFAPVTADQAGFVRRWGAAVEMRDLRRVVVAAADDGRRCVILGGHSFGGLEVPSYAAWDFHGKPGFRDLDGLMLIDGGMFNAFATELRESNFPPFKSVAEARTRIQELQTETPFGSDESPGIDEWQVGVVSELVCSYAEQQPQQPSGLQANGFGNLLLPKPPAAPVTNEAFAGLFNNQVLGRQGARLGHLAHFGNPHSWWTGGSRTNVPRFCATFTQEPGNGMEWYFPIRLEIDLAQGMQQLRPTPITRYLGLRPQHLSQIDTPLYALQTSLSRGGVLRAARKLVQRSRIDKAKLVDAATMRHYDPLMDVPTRNRFLKTAVPFLERTMHGAGSG